MAKAATNKRKEAVIYTTPKGVFVFANLDKPRDYDGNEQFAYDVGLVLKGAAADELAAQVDGWMKESKAAQPKLRKADEPYVPNTDRDKNEIPGETKFKFKVYATWPDGSSRQPKLWDAGGNLIPSNIKIGNGSTGYIKYVTYFTGGGQKAGVMLQPVAVQITKLVKPTGGFDNVGFAAAEDGEFTYSADEASFGPADGEAATGGEI